MIKKHAAANEEKCTLENCDNGKLDKAEPTRLGLEKLSIESDKFEKAVSNETAMFNMAEDSVNKTGRGGSDTGGENSEINSSSLIRNSMSFARD